MLAAGCPESPFLDAPAVLCLQVRFPDAKYCAGQVAGLEEEPRLAAGVCVRSLTDPLYLFRICLQSQVHHGTNGDVLINSLNIYSLPDLSQALCWTCSAEQGGEAPQCQS